MFLLIQRAASLPSSPAAADGGALNLLLLFYVALAVLNIAACWRIFTKAGEPGWTVLVPIYGSVKLLQISGRSGWWALAFLVPVFNIFPMVRLAFDLARVFGRGTGFALGLLFLPPIFTPLLAFGNAQYVGDFRRQASSTVLAHS